MSSTKSNSTELGAGGTNPGTARGSAVLVVVTVGLLGALVWALAPSQPHVTPAPLRPAPPGCPKGPQEFTPTNVTEIPDLPLDNLAQEEKYRVLLRLNMEPCPCGCNLSIAACRISNSACETSKEPAKKIAAGDREEQEKRR